MDRFFETLSLAFGYYGGNTKTSQVRMYVPAIVTMSYNGYYIYAMDKVGNTFEHTLSPKNYYATEDNGKYINLTLDDYVILNSNVTLNGIDSEDYTNAYGIKDKFGKYYTEDMIPAMIYNPLYATGTFDSNHIIGDMGDISAAISSYTGSTDGEVNSDDLDKLKELVSYFIDYNKNYDLLVRGSPTSTTYYAYNHAETPEYLKYWWADINQDGYIDDYDVTILQKYLTTSASYKTAREGRVVDLSHFEDITDTSSNGLYTETSGDITYEKSFYTQGGIRYLLEEWYKVEDIPGSGDTKNIYLYRRMTPYTEEDYAFTKALEKDYASSWLVNGNPENTGFVNPLTGEYEIGAFHARRKEIITKQVTEKLEAYVMRHNQFAGALGITYNFVLPEVVDTDWSKALNDITIMAFVQGIPILGQQYYNNYGISGSNLINKEFFIRCRSGYLWRRNTQC